VQCPIQVRCKFLRSGVCQAVRELLEKLIGRMFRADHPLAHGQGLDNGRAEHLAHRGIDEDLVVLERRVIFGTKKGCLHHAMQSDYRW
jgi:hypothetical protein